MEIEKIKKEIIKRLEKIDTFDSAVYVVTFNDRRLKMASGKSSWGSIGAAKNALRHNIPHIDSYGQLPAIKELEAEGIIEYIKL